jgi:hypothetical protein
MSIFMVSPFGVRKPSATRVPYLIRATSVPDNDIHLLSGTYALKQNRRRIQTVACMRRLWHAAATSD